jgi:hypothetical protein
MNETGSVSETVVQRALAAVAGHPLHAEAIAGAYCASDVFAEPKSFVDRVPCSEQDRERLREALANASVVLVVSYWTSERKPEPLSGYGKLYGFLVHPETFAVLKAEVGTWRS